MNLTKRHQRGDTNKDKKEEKKPLLNKEIKEKKTINDNLEKNLIDEEEKIHTKQPRNVVDKINSGKYDDKIITVLVLIALVVRLLHINNPKQVVFDEVHFGGFANKYLSRKFFMDVHPPLAKLMITWVSQIFMYDASFPFKNIGDDIPNNVPYIQMRVFLAILGILLIPVSFNTIKALGFSTMTATFTAILVLFENSLATQSRLILLDSPLLLFTGFTIMSWAKFQQFQKMPFKADWWKWLTLTGIGLGLVSSVKWVGLFSVAAIGLATINNLWNLLGDLKNSMKTFAKHFMARALCLIVIPVSIYCFFFYIHFKTLNLSGSGASFMSPQFQTSFYNSTIPQTQAEVGYGSEITIRHLNTNGGYLHSHGSNYPTGSKQQQITCYSHRDPNNKWIIQKVNNSDNINGFEPVRNGDTIRLLHKSTNRRLHSHDNEVNKPPISQQDFQYEATGYGNPSIQDSNDFWTVDIIGGKEKEELKAITSKFRLVHVNNKCALYTHPVKLPEWGFSQQEVTCGKGALKKNTIWFIENNTNKHLEPKKSHMITYEKPSFLKKLIELNVVMWNVNKGLTSSHPYESHPSSWLFLRRGISFWTGKESYVGRIYLTGNPVSWYLGAAAVLFYIFYFLFSHLNHQLRVKIPIFDINSKYYCKGGFLFTAYFWHYFPFFVMGRQLFIHHYLPCVYITILLFGITMETLLSRVNKKVTLAVYTVIALLSIISFIIYSPFTYGTFMSTKHCDMMRLRRTWDWDCKYYDKNKSKLIK